MNKFIAGLGVSVVAVCSLVGCGSNSSSNPTPKMTTYSPTETPSDASLGDYSPSPSSDGPSVPTTVAGEEYTLDKWDYTVPKDMSSFEKDTTDINAGVFGNDFVDPSKDKFREIHFLTSDKTPSDILTQLESGFKDHGGTHQEHPVTVSGADRAIELIGSEKTGDSTHRVQYMDMILAYKGTGFGLLSFTAYDPDMLSASNYGMFLKTFHYKG